MIAEPFRRSMSVEEYLALDRASQDARYEYIDGVVTLLAGGTSNHARISVSITSQLYSLLRHSSCQVYNSDMRVSIAYTRYVYPDISVSCNPRDQEDGNDDIIHHPCLVVEVLSSHTEAYDRGKKFEYYRECPSIQEIALVSSQEQAVDLYRRASARLWTLHPYRAGDDIELRSIDVTLPISSFYESVSF